MIKIESAETTPELVIRRLNSGDAEIFNSLRLTALQKNPKNFACDYETESQVPLEVTKKHLDTGIYIGIFEGVQLVGTVCLHKEQIPKLSHKGDVREMYVDETKRGRGIGKKLLEELIKTAKEEGLSTVMLAVWQQNEPAVRLYRSLGFKTIAEESRALKLADGTFIDEYLMSLDIRPDAPIETPRKNMKDSVAKALEVPIDDGVFATGYREAFEKRETYAESQMHDAIDRLLELIATDSRFAEAWTQAWERAIAFDSMRYSKAPNTSRTSDQMRLSELTENIPNVERLVTYLTESLKSHFEESTFRELGNPHILHAALESYIEQRPSNLPEIARHFRDVLDTKVLQNAARDILAERNNRLAAACGLKSIHQIRPAHRWRYPHFAHITQEQLMAFLEGDRSESVYGIGAEVVQEDSRVA